MEQLEEDLYEILGSLGFWGVLIVCLVFGLTSLVKWPLKKWAERWAKENNSDKKVITRWFFAIPLVLSFILSLIFILWKSAAWDVTAISWKEVASATISYAVAPCAIYEWLDNFRKSDEAVAKLNYSLPSGATSEDVKAAKKAAKAKARAEEKEAKARAKADAEVKAKQARKAELEKELAALNAQPNTAAEATAKASAQPVQQTVRLL